MEDNYKFLCNCCKVNIYIDRSINDKERDNVEKFIINELSDYMNKLNKNISLVLNNIFIEKSDSEKVRETDEGDYFKNEKCIRMRYMNTMNLIDTLIHELTHAELTIINLENDNLYEDNLVESKFLNEFLAYKSIEKCVDFKFIKDNLDLFLEEINKIREKIYKLYQLNKQAFNQKKARGNIDEFIQCKNTLNIYNYYHRGFALDIVLNKYGYDKLFKISESNFLENVKYYITKEDLENTKRLIDTLELK
ncbi:hypothetical protein HYH38_08435 [Clostridium botulinum]|uniref:hypothetical protein n=1 Tax=Clostridium botulinum TaxID=1491 RepID=UPI001967A82D|nr:hypothetical protein [Clostridium botulinum]MBN1071536.1 hypothetical protein [Clostridium botulinum]MBY6816438.1 hypothetical protein [Clostridium botulinum]MBY6827307.1 hypothetical protein [Clostridium botulinum]MBY6859255.1 hypothetical protein [Clostridium botulinum]MBY7041461.1 hypothetical protein [Clostridium botulinum]